MNYSRIAKLYYSKHLQLSKCYTYHLKLTWHNGSWKGSTSFIGMAGVECDDCASVCDYEYKKYIWFKPCFISYLLTL